MVQSSSKAWLISLLGLVLISKAICLDPTVSPTNITGEKPQFLYPSVMQSAKSEYKEGDKFELTCEAKGTPSPVVTWYKNGQIYTPRISAGRYDYKVIFIEVDINDEGLYVCNVSNAFGFLTYSYNFTIQENLRSPPRAYVIWEQRKPIYVGEDVELFCAILTRSRNTKYRWYYSDAELPKEKQLGVLIDPRLYKQPLYNGSRTHMGHVRFTLKLQNLTIEQSGHYGCQAENSVGNDSYVTSLTVTYRHTIPVTTVPEDRNTSPAQGKNSSTSAVTEREKTSWTSRIQYPWVFIGVSVAVIFALIIVTVWFCWKLKKVRTYAGRPSPGIASLQPKYDVHNEYVVVPDFK